MLSRGCHEEIDNEKGRNCLRVPEPMQSRFMFIPGGVIHTEDPNINGIKVIFLSPCNRLERNNMRKRINLYIDTAKLYHQRPTPQAYRCPYPYPTLTHHENCNGISFQVCTTPTSLALNIFS
jgi:hypothetical protein